MRMILQDGGCGRARSFWVFAQVQVWLWIHVICTGTAYSENVRWTNTVSGLFSNPRNWRAGPQSNNRVPTAADDVSVLPADLTITVDGDQKTHLLFLSVPVTFQVSGRYSVAEFFPQSAMNWTGGGELAIGVVQGLDGVSFSGLRARVGLLDLPADSLSSPRALEWRVTGGAKVVSEQARVAGKILVDQAGEWEHLGDFDNRLTDGTRVPGQMVRIREGGVVRFHAARLAQVEVDSGGRWNGGSSEVLYLWAHRGGSASSDASRLVGNATLDGAGSGWVIAGLLAHGAGSLLVTNQALLSAGDFTLEAGTDAVVTGAGSRSVVGRSMRVRSPYKVQQGGSGTAAILYLGERAKESGAVGVMGLGSSLVVGERMEVGGAGAGSLTVSDRAQVEAAAVTSAVLPASVGQARISDLGVFTVRRSAVLGDEGIFDWVLHKGGRMNLDAGAALTLAAGASGRGEFRVADPGSWLDARGGALTVARNGNATLRVSAGGRMSGRTLEVAAAPGSEGRIEVQNGRLELEGELTLGKGGHGRMLLQEGGIASLRGDVGLGRLAGGQGTLTVDGASSLLEMPENDTGLIVGVDGLGDLHVQNGGQVRVPAASIAYSSLGVVTVDGPGSLFRVEDRLYVGGLPGHDGGGTLVPTQQGLVQVGRLLCVQQFGIVQMGGGSIQVGSVSGANPNEIRVGPGGVLGGDGSLANAKVMVLPGGKVTAGCSIGRLKIDGSLQVQSGAFLEMEVGGLKPGETHDFLQVSGPVELGGTLVVSFVGGYAPAAGESFDLFRWETTATGQFESVRITGLAEGFDYSISRVGSVQRLTALKQGISTSPPVLTVVQQGSELLMTWPPTATGYRLEGTRNVTMGPWEGIPGQGNSAKVPLNGAHRFFRLVK